MGFHRLVRYTKYLLNRSPTNHIFLKPCVLRELISASPLPFHSLLYRNLRKWKMTECGQRKEDVDVCNNTIENVQTTSEIQEQPPTEQMIRWQRRKQALKQQALAMKDIQSAYSHPPWLSPSDEKLVDLALEQVRWKCRLRRLLRQLEEELQKTGPVAKSHLWGMQLSKFMACGEVKLFANGITWLWSSSVGIQNTGGEPSEGAILFPLVR